MIVVAGTVDLDPARRDAALAAAESLLAPTRDQTGCRSYTWTADLAIPGRISVFEVWDDESALAAHFAGPWYRRMLETLGGFGLRGAEVFKYRADRREPVYDETGRPRADFPA